jgi:hypothetical protein
MVRGGQRPAPVGARSPDRAPGPRPQVTYGAGRPAVGAAWRGPETPHKLERPRVVVLAKPAGILLFSWLAVRLGLGRPPAGVSGKGLFGSGCLGYIGFTIRGADRSTASGAHAVTRAGSQRSRKSRTRSG